MQEIVLSPNEHGIKGYDEGESGNSLQKSAEKRLDPDAVVFTAWPRLILSLYTKWYMTSFYFTLNASVNRN